MLPKGIVSVLQTPFSEDKTIDWGSMERLIDDAIHAGVDGFLAPAVASEVDYLTKEERIKLIRFVYQKVQTRVPVIIGASTGAAIESREYAQVAQEIEADAYLAAVPQTLYNSPDDILPFFNALSQGISLPLIIQDLQWNGYGLKTETIKQLKEAVKTFAGIKIETVPAGPKYTEVRNALGNDFYICGGWAITQLIEALDRGVDAMIPESSMIRVYKKIVSLYKSGNRRDATQLFRKMLPILTYTNQEITTSIAFFKYLLARKDLFKTTTSRQEGFIADQYTMQILNDLTEIYFQLEREI